MNPRRRLELVWRDVAGLPPPPSHGHWPCRVIRFAGPGMPATVRGRVNRRLSALFRLAAIRRKPASAPETRQNGIDG